MSSHSMAPSIGMSVEPKERKLPAEAAKQSTPTNRIATIKEWLATFN